MTNHFEAGGPFIFSAVSNFVTLFTNLLFRIVSQFGPMLTDLTVDQLKEKQVLAESHAHFYRLRTGKAADSNKEVRTRVDVFDKYRMAIEEYMINNMEYHKAIASLVNNIQSGRILILVERCAEAIVANKLSLMKFMGDRLAHGDAIHQLIPGSFWVTGQDSTDTREYVFEQLRKSTKPKVVAICSNIGFYGLNVYVHHVINASGGKDPSMVIQKIGRGLRKAEDKDKLEYHDFILDHPTLKKHAIERKQTLEKEGHKVTTH